MNGLGSLIRRNTKLFFKDKGMFFTSLITPIILLVLYITFLGDAYKDVFSSIVPAGLAVDEKLINATVGGQLVSSLLAVCCITVAFCSNLLMVQDKITGARNDLTITPVKHYTMSLAYFISSAMVTLIICFVAIIFSFIYLKTMGWYLSTYDCLLIFLDVFLLVLFGTALSSIVSYPLSTQGQASSVGTIVSSGYGFICGAYMPLSNFSEGLQKVLSFFPGTYGTSLLRNHALRAVYQEMSNQGFPTETIENIKNSIDCNLYFFGNKVELSTMYLILVGSVFALIGIYVIIAAFGKNKK